jgi:hypothetical protein
MWNPLKPSQARETTGDLRIGRSTAEPVEKHFRRQYRARTGSPW